MPYCFSWRTGLLLLITSSSVYGITALAHTGVIEEVLVIGRKNSGNNSQVGAATGNIDKAEIDTLPSERAGDLLGLIPGLIATQHSGSGKANQYFLRGVNLDHGTDFSTRLDFMPLNMVSHGHGQGYTDLNFIIPELIQSLNFRKGPFYADMGDFSGTGEAHFHSVAFLPENLISAEIGEFGHRRAFAANQWAAGAGQWLLAGEWQTNDGPWDNVDEDVNKKNIWLKYAAGNWQAGTDVTFMAYDNRWSAADQVPLRAVQDGRLPVFSTVDPSSGGESYRYSLSWQKRTHSEQTAWLLSAYAIRYRMDLWSNFTYFTAPEGDQFYQHDNRSLLGSEIAYTTSRTILGKEASHTLGWQTRLDYIDPVALYSTSQRHILDVVREDKIQQLSNGLYWHTAWQLTQDWTSAFNLRWNFHYFDVDAVDASLPMTTQENSGSASDHRWSAAWRLRYTLAPNSDAYLNLGRGYHSNDARGIFTRADPISGEPVTPADPTVPIDNLELGGNWTSPNNTWAVSTALWMARIKSEVVFVGDEGTTEDLGAKSLRRGLETTVAFRPTPDSTLNFDYAYTQTEIQDASLLDSSIPGALDHVAGLRASHRFGDAWQTSVQWRYFGSYHLGDGIYADSSQKADFNLRYQTDQNITYTLSIFNIFDSGDYDIEYWYASQLQGETGPIYDRHTHRLVPRNFRLKVEYGF